MGTLSVSRETWDCRGADQKQPVDIAAALGMPARAAGALRPLVSLIAALETCGLTDPAGHPFRGDAMINQAGHDLRFQLRAGFAESRQSGRLLQVLLDVTWLSASTEAVTVQAVRRHMLVDALAGVVAGPAALRVVGEEDGDGLVDLGEVPLDETLVARVLRGA